MSPTLIQLLAFQGAWFACILGAAHGRAWLGPVVVALLLAVYLGKSRRPVEDLRYLALATFLGVALDSTLVAAGLIEFQGSPLPLLPLPLWMPSLWAIFASTLRETASWLAGRWALGLLLGAVAGPLSYGAGARLGAAELLGDGAWPILAVAAEWALALPLLQALAWPRSDAGPDAAAPLGTAT